LFIATLLFFISGSAALIYQTGWQRLLVIFAGGDIQAITLIVSAFMLGLGGGNLAGGWLADRQSTVKNLLTFAAIEAAIGLWGLGSEWLYHDLLCQRLGALTSARFTSAIVLIAALLPPTFLMGMSLPLLVRALTRRVDEAAARIGQLYGINTLGAAAGALLTTWCLLPLMGISGSITTAVVMNLLCALGILPLVWLTGEKEPALSPPAAADISPQLTPRMRGYLLLHAITGFLALGLEITWFRVLGVMLKSTAFTFGTLLGIYLGGLGLGALIGTLRVHHSQRPLRNFLWMQAALALYAGLSLAIMLWVIHHAVGCQSLLAYLDSYEPLDVNTSIALLLDPVMSRTGLPDPMFLPLLHGLIPILLIMPATFLMGLSFPYLQKAVQTHPDQIGTRVGWLQAANIAGSVAGTLIVGMGLLSWFGSSGTLELLVLIGTALGALALLGTQKLRFKAAAWLALSLITLLAIPGSDDFWASIHGTTADKLVHVEDSTGVTAFKAVKPTPEQPGDTIVYVNGIGQSWLPYGGIHSILGALPALLHPRPERVAIIGLGSGDTAYCAAARYETEHVSVVEIIAGQTVTMRQHHARHPSTALNALLSDEHIHHVHADGRRFLMMSDQRFDIIEADALRPNSAGSGILYSEEYFRLVSKRLKPGGYAVTWVPTPRVRNTFLRVFPHVLDLGVIAIGSPDPITASANDLRRRLGFLEIRQHFNLADIPIQQLLAPYTKIDFRAHLIGPETDRSDLTDINTDLFPRDEFHLPALWSDHNDGPAK
jgi:spermidine synthase